MRDVRVLGGDRDNDGPEQANISITRFDYPSHLSIAITLILTFLERGVTSQEGFSPPIADQDKW
jgi:hypothetical protein